MMSRDFLRDGLSWQFLVTVLHNVSHKNLLIKKKLKYRSIPIFKELESMYSATSLVTLACWPCHHSDFQSNQLRASEPWHSCCVKLHTRRASRWHPWKSNWSRGSEVLHSARGSSFLVSYRTTPNFKEWCRKKVATYIQTNMVIARAKKRLILLLFT